MIRSTSSSVIWSLVRS